MFVTGKPVSQHRPQTLGSINRFSAVTSILRSLSPARIRIHFFLSSLRVGTQLYIYYILYKCVLQSVRRVRTPPRSSGDGGKEKNSPDRPSHPNLGGRLRPTNHYNIIILSHTGIFFVCTRRCCRRKNPR